MAKLVQRRRGTTAEHSAFTGAVGEITHNTTKHTLVIHDGTTATIVEESAVATGSMLGTFTATISSSNLLMQVNMGSATSATVTVKADNITV